MIQAQKYHPSFNTKPKKLAHFVKPMLATLTEKAFDSPDWLFEIKWDGYRAIAEINGKNTKLYSRNGLSFNDEYAVIYNDLLNIKEKAVIDGEIVALDEQGKPSFQQLQHYDTNGEVPIVYYVFDVLKVGGKDVTRLPLTERKKLLKELLPQSDVVRYCDDVTGTGIAFFKATKENGLEGMIAKKADSIYQQGTCSTDWLKVKNVITEEAVIAGYTAPRGGRKYFGALMLGTYEQDVLEYIGHTGTGFDDHTLKEIYTLLQPLVTDKKPFKGQVAVNAPVTWVKPELVCNLKYTEITTDGKRRHPVFMGLRQDKAPKEVHKEIAMDKTPAKTAPQAAKKSPIVTKSPLTHLDKIYWPDEGYTKGDVINYYNVVYKYIIPYLKGRPESLKRTPNGINGEAFYHKDAGEKAPEWMDTYPTWSESAGKTVDYLLCNNKQSLLYIANLGCIELNPWNSRIDSPDKPDYLVIDLDPSDNNTFSQVVECANVVKEILDKAGAPSYCKTSGATGLHIYVPLGAKYTYEQARQFSEIVAHLVQEQLPATTTLERSLSKRSKDKIYVDYLQNKQGSTLACAYSLRPKPGATVSTPLDWKEVNASLHPTDFNINNTLQRLQKVGDLFAPVLKTGMNMDEVLKKLSA